MQALGLLHEEAMKSFARGSKAAADFIDAYSKRVKQRLSRHARHDAGASANAAATG